MSVKRILTALRLDKIAAVDRPCQEPATADLIKRAADFDTFVKAKYDTKQREAMAGKGEAMKDGSYPIADAEDLSNAIHAVGRGRNNSHSAIRRHIIARAKALGMSDKIPETWTDGGKLAKSIYDALGKSGIPLDDPDGDEGAQAFDEVLGEQELTQTFWDAWYEGTSALQESICSILKDDGETDKATAVQNSIKQFADYVEQIVPGDVGKSLAEGISASVGQAGITSGVDAMSSELKKALGLPETATEADVLKAIAEKDAALTKANEDLAKAKAKKPDPEDILDDGADEDAEMSKALKSGDAFRTPEGKIITKKAVGDDIFTVLKSQNDRLVKAEDEVKKAREAELDRAFAKRSEEMGFGTEFGPTLRKALNGDEAAGAELTKRIAGLTKMVDESEFVKTFGHSQPGADSATAEFMAKVDEARKANPTLTEAQAYTKVYTDRANVELKKRMNAETKAAA